MSRKEVDRLAVIEKVISKQVAQNAAADMLGITTRQLRRLQRKYQQEGPGGLISKHRGKPSNNRLTPEIKALAIQLIREHYYDFRPTLAHEKLVEKHKLKLSLESVRQLMMKEQIWAGKKRKTVHVHQRRARRTCLGELVQIDGSPHDWFEGRRQKCCLIVMIDDATSRLMWLHFAEEETTEAYFIAIKEYLKHYGRPICFYSDRNSIFRVNIAESESGTGETQFGRAMRELGIENICANSPQAKGRVEKANGTLQDRLTKEMRLKCISDIPTANAYLPEFIADYNKRFAVEAANKNDTHRREIPNDEILNLILSEQHERTITKNLEVSYKNIVYQIQLDTPGYTMRNAKLTVCETQGNITLLYKGKSLPYKTFDKNNKPTEILSSQQLNNSPKIKRLTKPKSDHPWRNYQNRKIKRTTSETRAL